MTARPGFSPPARQELIVKRRTIQSWPAPAEGESGRGSVEPRPIFVVGTPENSARRGERATVRRAARGYGRKASMSHPQAASGAVAADAGIAIAVEGIVKRYGPLTAVNNVSFAVRKGETFGLLGPNGAGKTTTLEIIEGLRIPDEGRVVVQGIDVKADPRRARAIMGIQLQEAGLFDRLTVAETIRLFS